MKPYIELPGNVETENLGIIKKPCKNKGESRMTPTEIKIIKILEDVIKDINAGHKYSAKDNI